MVLISFTGETSDKELKKLAEEELLEYQRELSELDNEVSD